MTECKFSQLACSLRELIAFALSYIVTAISSQSGFAASSNFFASGSTFAARLVDPSGQVYMYPGGESHTIHVDLGVKMLRVFRIFSRKNMTGHSALF